MRLFVGGLSYTTTSEELKRHIENHGIKVEKVIIILNRETNQSKGFGFADVEVGSPSSDVIRTLEENAIRILDKTELDGKILTVNRANPKPEYSDEDKARFKKRDRQFSKR
jgi:RNA recognition motif-containing protein